MKLLFLENIPIQNIADRFGVDRTTTWRWKKKWLALNQNVQLKNLNRQIDNPISAFRFASCVWIISTISSAPHSHPNQLPDYLVRIVLDVRECLQRCAEAVWFYLRENLGIEISLSSVRRVLKRNGCLNSRRKKRNYRYKGLRKPNILAPGDFIETDTIHLYNPISKKKRYLYTVIDVYTRASYVKECTGSYYLKSEPLDALNMRISNYLDCYNHRRIHLGLKCMTPMQMPQRR